SSKVDIGGVQRRFQQEISQVAANKVQAALLVTELRLQALQLCPSKDTYTNLLAQLVEIGRFVLFRHRSAYSCVLATVLLRRCSNWVV
ncbi:MAG TPA: hypothetical protein VGP33_15920, partial [Chloroflexota bacterium]|nr:hypothetical protein [Chloroflexota bacterium]